MSDKFNPGDKVWALSKGSPDGPARGVYAGVVVGRLSPEITRAKMMADESYEVDIPGLYTGYGATEWYVEVWALRPRHEGPEEFPELTAEDKDPLKTVKWDWKKELRVDNVEVPA